MNTRTIIAFTLATFFIAGGFPYTGGLLVGIGCVNELLSGLEETLIYLARRKLD